MKEIEKNEKNESVLWQYTEAELDEIEQSYLEMMEAVEVDDK